MRKESTVSILGYDTPEEMKQIYLLERLRPFLFNHLKQLYSIGYRTFITGMCEGFDLFIANQVLELRDEYDDISLIAVIPFQGQELGYSAENKVLYDTVYKMADELIFTMKFYDENAYSIHQDYIFNNGFYKIIYKYPKNGDGQEPFFNVNDLLS